MKKKERMIYKNFNKIVEETFNKLELSLYDKESQLLP